MARYSLNLPVELKADAEQLAALQGVSLNQFILWSLSEKVGALRGRPNDIIRYPHIDFFKGASGKLWPSVRGTRIRVQTIAIMHNDWGMSAQEIADEYDTVSKTQVENALCYYRDHQSSIDIDIAQEDALEQAYEQTKVAH